MDYTIYQKLLKTIYALFESNVFPTGSLESIKETFVNGFVDVIKTTIETNIDYKKLDKSIEQFRRNVVESEDSVNILIAESLENPAAYAIFNYFLISFIEVLLQNVPRENLEKAKEITASLEIDNSLSQRINERYESYIKWKKEQAKLKK